MAAKNGTFWHFITPQKYQCTLNCFIMVDLDLRHTSNQVLKNSRKSHGGHLGKWPPFLKISRFWYNFWTKSARELMLVSKTVFFHIRGFWWLLSRTMTSMFHLRVHLTSKSKMAPFDLYWSTAKLKNSICFACIWMKIYSMGFWGPVSRIVTFNFHSGVHLTFKSKMAAFDLYRGTAKNR